MSEPTKEPTFTWLHEEEEVREKARFVRIRKIRFISAAIICAITLAALIFLFSPYFHISTIVIEGNMRVSREEVLTRLETTSTTHLLFFNTGTARGRLAQNMYISDVTFERVLPDRLYVYISERRLTAYVEHIPGSFLFLDDHGRVLEIRSSTSDPLPILEGLEFTRFQLGEILEVPDATAFNIIVQYAQLINHHNLAPRVSHINVADPTNIRIIIDANKEFNVGNSLIGADERIRWIVAAVNEIPPDIPGFMDLRYLRDQHSFELLQ
ncbi:MAG: FtsQ-type POTRA domain-containing protein [Defluviitaleaceae bacterium]|nr:FtsQ-type POTRA domain-containing protein [Defluviitaleaceae bacterium]